MTHTFSRRFLLAVAALLAVAVYRVDSVPAPPAPYGGYTWHSALDEARFQVEATVTGIRREILEAEAAVTTMWRDIETLHDVIGLDGPP